MSPILNFSCTLTLLVINSLKAIFIKQRLQAVQNQGVMTYNRRQQLLVFGLSSGKLLCISSKFKSQLPWSHELLHYFICNLLPSFLMSCYQGLQCFNKNLLQLPREQFPTCVCLSRKHGLLNMVLYGKRLSDKYFFTSLALANTDLGVLK